MRQPLLLLTALAICSPALSYAQEQSQITFNPGAGGYQQNPPTVSTPIGPPIEFNPQLNEVPQPAPANELVPSEKKNVIEEAAQKLWRLILTFQTGVYYDSNIFISENNAKGDTVFQVAGGFTFEIGDYRSQTNNFLKLKYLATAYFYADRSNLNGVNQDFVLNGQYRFSRLTLQSNIAFSYLNGPDRLAGTFTDRYYIDSLFRALYDLTDKTQLHAEFEQISSLYPSQFDSFEYIGRLGADYLITPKIKLGVEGVIGSLHIESGGESFYGQGRARAAYKFTEKLIFLASAGFEVRNYGSRDYVKATPVFDLGVQYSPFVDTTLGLTAFRRIFASPVEVGQVFTATGLQASVGQRFFQRFGTSVFFGYEHDSYNASGANAINLQRTDDYVYVQPNISYEIGDWFTVNVYYQYSHNDSSLHGASFDDHRVGMRAIFAF